MATAEYRVRDSRVAIQGLLLLDMFVRLLVWAASMVITTMAFTSIHAWPSSKLIGADLFGTWEWAQFLISWVVLYNIVYVGVLVALRLPIPTPREGRYTLKPGQRPDRQLIWSVLIAVLTKAQYEAPFPAFLVYQICNLPPISWWVTPTLGPRSRSCNVTQPVLGDPHLIQFGRNVVMGYGCCISGHTQERDAVTIARTTIEDDVLIGAYTLVYGGCTIRRGAVVLGGAVVQPFTTIGENEVWGGVPARKIKDLPPLE
jgi:hypothetical protein